MSPDRQMCIAEYSLVIFISLSFLSSSSLHKALSSELMQESKFKEGKGLHAYKAKGGGGAGGHASGGHASGHVSPGHTSPHNGGNGGESRTPTQGGAVIPAYVAGAAGAANANNQHHRSHHGTNNGSFNRIEFPIMLTVIFLYTPLLHLCLFI
ncbi:uncharacterized protein LOC114754750 isoform X2 [Neltuma alba]|uniref:uncharacterized protein LOC114754750 isoform X2 n=1 Tax=Neltuma alba TaxID=207710 RepID=UPI0010A4947A|nr:uncharacterized protein LOC114754750 isoform X2 [Prosopis alba]